LSLFLSSKWLHSLAMLMFKKHRIYGGKNKDRFGSNDLKKLRP